MSDYSIVKTRHITWDRGRILDRIQNYTTWKKCAEQLFSVYMPLCQDWWLGMLWTGFEYSNVACCSTGLYEMGYLCNQFNPCTCADANKYVFWDSFHPSEKTNQIIADYILKRYLHVFMWCNYKLLFNTLAQTGNCSSMIKFSMICLNWTELTEF